MPGYEVSTTTLRIGASDYRIRSLADRRQYFDPDGRAERAGVDPASWSLFGVVWPAGVALAQEMSVLALGGQCILEVGCGLGLASLVLQRRGADITASDRHPLAEAFMRHNTDLNGMAPIGYRDAPWGALNPALGRFDLIIGADVLYERDHPALLAGFIHRHARPGARVIVADPGRPHCGRFSARMTALGFRRTERRVHFAGSENPASLGRVMSFVRGRDLRPPAGDPVPGAPPERGKSPGRARRARGRQAFAATACARPAPSPEAGCAPSAA